MRRSIASRSTSPGHSTPESVANGSLIVTKFPRLLDIFSPSTCRKPLCIQTFAIAGVPKRAADLRDLVLVVGEDEVDAAGVDVEDLAEMLPRHRRALDVPAGAARRGNPAGKSQEGSPGFDGFQSTKSSGERL